MIRAVASGVVGDYFVYGPPIVAPLLFEAAAGATEIVREARYAHLVGGGRMASDPATPRST